MLPGLSWPHFILFAVVAIIVIGPKDLPRVMRTMGRFLGKARAMAREFQDSFEEIAREAEMEDMRKEAEKLRAEMAPLSAGPPIPLTPAEEETLIAAHNAKVLEAEAASISQPAPVAAEGVETVVASSADNVTPIRGVRR